MLRMLLTNLQTSRETQDLFFKNMADWRIDVAMVTEPNNVPGSSVWFGDELSKVAVVLNASWNVSCVRVCSGRGYCAVKCEDVLMVAGYLSPNSTRLETMDYVNELERVIRDNAGAQVLLLGDFNARSVMWGCATENDRRFQLLELTTNLDLRLINVGSAPTCVRAQGSSVVDTCWGNVGLMARIKNWRVLVNEEFLSDHHYVRFDMERWKKRRRIPEVAKLVGPHWSRTKFRLKLYKTTLDILFAGIDKDLDKDVDSLAQILRARMTSACDMAGSRSVKSYKRRHSWWTEEVAEAHASCLRLRRACTRMRRRKVRRDGEGTQGDDDHEYAEYVMAKRELRRKLKKVKGNNGDC